MQEILNIKERVAQVILRGIRTLSDMEYEFGMTLTNHRLDPEIEGRGRRGEVVPAECGTDFGLWPSGRWAEHS
jgi:hypothetical protein